MCSVFVVLECLWGFLLVVKWREGDDRLRRGYDCNVYSSRCSQGTQEGRFAGVMHAEMKVLHWWRFIVILCALSMIAGSHLNVSCIVADSWDSSGIAPCVALLQLLVRTEIL